MSEGKPILLTGIKPTGEIHIGNYFGVIKPALDLIMSGTYDPYIFIANYHALNFIQNAEEMKDLSISVLRTYLAAGLDPQTVTLFKQSDVPAHTELEWIFDTITTMPYLMRAHAFKDAEAKNKEISVGTFNYPMLMAADIVLYDAAVVPIGQDQKQHIEYARDTAQKFNHIFGETFTLPEPYILPTVATVPGTDGRKMSKSYGNTIPLFSDRETIIEKVMGIVTDSSGERPENVYAIHKLLKSDEELAPLYEEHAGKYKALKEALIEDLDTFISPLRKRYEEQESSLDTLEQILTDGAARANKKAHAKMQVIKKAVGVL